MRQAFSKHLRYNFATWDRTLETLTYVWLGTGPFLIVGAIGFAQLSRKPASDLDRNERLLYCAFATMTPLYLIFNAIGGRLREIRISFPLMLAAGPLALYYLKSRGGRFSLDAFHGKSLLPFLAFLPLAALLGTALVLEAFLPYAPGRSHARMAGWRNAYFAFELLVLAALWLAHLFTSPARAGHQPPVPNRPLNAPAPQEAASQSQTNAQSSIPQGNDSSGSACRRQSRSPCSGSGGRSGRQRCLPWTGSNTGCLNSAHHRSAGCPIGTSSRILPSSTLAPIRA